MDFLKEAGEWVVGLFVILIFSGMIYIFHACDGTGMSKREYAHSKRTIPIILGGGVMIAIKKRKGDTMKKQVCERCGLVEAEEFIIYENERMVMVCSSCGDEACEQPGNSVIERYIPDAGVTECVTRCVKCGSKMVWNMTITGYVCPCGEKYIPRNQ